MKAFYGMATLPDGDTISILPDDEFHTLDGFKLANVFISSTMTNQEEVQTLIDFLMITKHGFVK